MQSYLYRQLCMGLALSGMLMMTSCLDNEETEFEKQVKLEDQLIENYLQTNNLTATRDNTGLYYEVLQSNSTGEPVETDDVVSVRYTMHTLTGKLIDSLTTSARPDTSVRFQHSSGALYPQGINQGVRLMNKGEKFRFYIPSYMAFSSYLYKTLLPSEAILIVDVEVSDVESLDDIKQEEETAIASYITDHSLEGVSEKSSGIYYQQLAEGSGSTPGNGKAISVAYKGYYLNNEVFGQTKENETYQFILGDVNQRPIKGFEEAIKLMKKGEKARVFIPSHLAYGPGIQIIPGVLRSDFLKTYQMRDIRPYQPLVFEIEIKDIK